MSYSWIKFRGANFRNPAFRKLIRAATDNLYRWMMVCLAAAEADNDGRLTYGRSSIAWSVEDLADQAGHPSEEFSNFIQLALELDLLEHESDGTLRLVDWEDWYGQNALTGAERQKRYREKKRSGSPSEAGCNTVTKSNEAASHPRNESNDPKQSRAEQTQSRSEKEQSRAEQSESNALVSAACLPALSETEFLSRASALCEQLTQKPLDSKAQQHLAKVVAERPWSGFDWRAKAGALELATQRAAWRLTPKAEGGPGEKSKHPWRWMLSWAPDHLDEAHEVAKMNDFAQGNGFPPNPLTWSPEDEA